MYGSVSAPAHSKGRIAAGQGLVGRMYSQSATTIEEDDINELNCDVDSIWTVFDMLAARDDAKNYLGAVRGGVHV